MTLAASVHVGTGQFRLRADLHAADREVVAVLGPNGAGKTTLLRTIAGLVPIDGGYVEIAGAMVDEPASGTFVPPARRRIGYVPQDHVLFPHLSALDNVAFGLRARRVPAAEARAEAARWLDRLGVGEQSGLMPASLSGGQAQRVALARALAVEPAVLLLDEPLAALDARTRPHVRAELRRHLAGFDGARLLVTHDPVDAVVLADRIVVLEAGQVVQAGTPAEVVRRPASPFVADLAGINLLRGTSAGGHLVRLATGAELSVATAAPSGDVAAAVRPRAVALHRERPAGSARNAWPVTVVDVVHDEAGERARITVTGPVDLVAEVTPAAVADLDLRPGTSVWAAVKAVDVDCYET